MNRLKKLSIVGGLALVPALAFAEDISNTDNIKNVLRGVQGIIDLMLPILVTLAVVIFFWGLVKYLFSAGDQKARDAGKGLMIWGVIALFVMVSIWGLTSLIGRLFNINQSQTIVVPGVPF